MIQGRVNTTDHIDEDELASYLDRTLSDADRRLIEAHLSACDECRAEVIASREAVSSAPTLGGSRFRSWRIIGGAVTAAAVIVVIGTLSRSRTDRDIERDANTTVPAVTIVNPADGSPLGTDRIVTWRALAENTSYRVTIADQSAQPIHTTTVRDTSAVIPQSVSLVAGRKYFWYVDAIRTDGTTATSGLKSFTVE
jgi:hypothetical protein